VVVAPLVAVIALAVDVLVVVEACPPAPVLEPVVVPPVLDTWFEQEHKAADAKRNMPIDERLMGSPTNPIDPSSNDRNCPRIVAPP
jgi:hypothetical protein